MELSIAAISLLLLLAHGANADIFDVTKYGAQNRGQSDISHALLSAWKDACACQNPSTVLIPKGTFLLSIVKLNGYCNAPLTIRLDGTLLAPVDPSQFHGSDSWITIQYINNLIISGSGTIDGQGSTAWSRNDCNKNTHCGALPVSLRLNFVNDSLITGITSKDSKNWHVAVLGANNLTFSNFHINAPGNSINTDGIHIGRSNRVNVTDSIIMTGDDCISLGDGSKQIYIERVTCGPGHGISVGSLGKFTFEQPVTGIYVKNCTISNTTTGLRIKTWPSAPATEPVSDIYYRDIIMNNVDAPILIDQYYCPSNLCTVQYPSRIPISNVHFDNIQGTSSNRVAVKLNCSSGVPCQNVHIGNINLVYNGPEGPATSACSNVRPILNGVQIPPVCTGSAQAS